MGNLKSIQVSSIDFKTFKEGDTYEITDGNKIYSARIGHFRKGIAVAGTSDFDCLVDVNCHIIFQPGPHNYSCGYTLDTRPCIKREVGGKYILIEVEDISAPGKDSFYKNVYTYIGEDGSSKITGKPIIPPYPMPIPYERGKVVCHGNKIYNLETYDFLFEFPDRPSFHLYSQLNYSEWEICDDLYNKLLLVEVDSNGIILSQKDVTPQRKDYEYQSLTPNQIFHKRRTLEYERYAFSDVYPMDFPCTRIREQEDVVNCIYQELENMANISTRGLSSGSASGNLENYHHLYHWLKATSSKYGDWRMCIARTYTRKYTITLVHYWNIYFISFLDYSYATYLFSSDGKVLNPRAYKHLLPINDKHSLYTNKLLFFDGEMGAISIDKTGRLTEISYIGSLLKDWQSALYRYHEPSLNTIEYSPYDVSTTFLMKPSNENDVSNYFANSYYDIFLNPLKVQAIEHEIEIETVIEKYLYKTPNGLWRDCDYFCKLSKPFKCGDKVFIPTWQSQILTSKALAKLLSGKSPYVQACYPHRSYDEASPTNLFIFEYQPTGRINMKGEIIHSLSPNDVYL